MSCRSGSAWYMLPLTSHADIDADNIQRGLLPNARATREELLERVKANLRVPRSSGQ